MKFPGANNKTLLILYSSGGTADVGRHAVRAALDMYDGPIRVLSKDPQTTLIKETNWKCACPKHTFTKEELERMDLRSVDVTKEDLAPHLQGVGACISALGNRNWHGDYVGKDGTKNLVKAMNEAPNVDRLVAVTSVGCNEDWPPMEFHWAGNILKWILRLPSRKGYRDLCEAENVITDTSEEELDYLIIRPVGLGEDRPPKNEWHVQKKKYEDKLGCDMSKLDCARFAVSQVLEPTYHRQAVVVGSDYDTFEVDPKKDVKKNEL